METEDSLEPKPLVRRLNGRMWQTGESGNPDGRPLGARGRFSQRFIADLATAWEQHGEAALARTATEYPDRFVGICTHLLPKDVSVSLSANLPAGLSADDWSIMIEVLTAARAALPAIGSRPPGAAFQLMRDALKEHELCSVVASTLPDWEP